MKKVIVSILCCSVFPVWAAPIIEPTGHVSSGIVLTVDMCSGHTDNEVIEVLIEQRAKATFFVTAKWISRNPEAVNMINAHPELFRVENHGEKHWAALVGEKSPYGIRTVGDLAGFQKEVENGQESIKENFPNMPLPKYYRSAGAQYDRETLAWLNKNQIRVGIYSIPADGGGKFPPPVVLSRLKSAKSGDIIILHGNHPELKNGAVLEKYLKGRDSTQFTWLE